MPVFIQYGDIKGDSTAKGHEGKDGWVEIGSFQFATSRSIASPVGGSKDREATAPTITDVVVTKPSDVSSTAWLEEALHGEGKTVKVDFCKTDKGELEVYQSYELENAIVSGFSVSSAGQLPVESISISFTKFSYCFHQMNASGDASQAPRTGYNLATGCKL